MATINKIKVGNIEYDIEASAIGNLSSINVESSQNAQTPEILIKSNSTGEKEAGNDADIRFECASNKSVATNGIVAGVVGLNTKGNLSIESLNKHVNIESVKGIQLKPTTNIIFDTSRRVAAPGHTADKDNEAVIEVKYDDLEVPNGQEYKQFGYLKFNSRAVDITCFWHGGIALQPAGIDGSGYENKIKFESSRKVSANETIPSDLRRDSSNYNNYYTIEGGKGVEFGTFNNEHTSIFTKDYRFNSDGIVFSVIRSAPITSGDKTDYTTQADDFKDIPIDNKGIGGIYNSSTKKWGISSNAGKYLIAASWNSIVKTANALNDRSWTDTNISGNNNLQITVADEVEWVEIPEYSGESVTLATDKQDPKRKYVGDGIVYKLIDDKYYTCQLKANGEHHLNLEADGTIKLESGFDDIELTAGDKVQASAPCIQLEATNIDANTGQNTGTVDFSTTPIVSFMARKINKNGGFESSDALLKITSLNNFGKTVYEKESGKIRIPYTTLYTNTGVYSPVIINTEKVAVYESDMVTKKPVGSYIVQLGNLNLLYTVEEGSGNNVLGKKAKVCNNSITPDLYTDSEASQSFVFEVKDYTGDEPTLYTAANTTASEGYYIVKDENNKTYIVYINNNGKLSQFNVNNNGTGNTFVQGWYLEGSKQIVGDYTDIIFGGNDEAELNETAVASGNPLNVSLSCSINDIITLVDYFKNGEGVEFGPWNH